MNLITSDVMRAMAGAASSAGQAGVSMGVYRQARAKGDGAGMDRAAGYAAGSMRAAGQQNQAAREALQEAQAQAREQEDIERRQALEDARAEARQREKARRAAEETSAQSEEANPPPIDGDGPAAPGASGEGRDSGDAAHSAPDQAVSRQAEGPAATAVLYTRQGEIRPSAPEQKLSVVL